MAKTAVIVAGGRISISFASLFFRNTHYDILIAVDGGSRICLELGLKIHAAVGDFDTLSKADFERLKTDKDTRFDVHIPEKDETDTELAIYTAEKLGCTHLILLGATGGRLDHELSNLQMLKYCLDHDLQAEIVDEQNRICLFRNRKTFRKADLYGKYVSFIPMTEEIRGFSLKGFKYPLEKKDLCIGVEAGRCISNELAEETAEAELDQGILICIESKDL